MDFISAHYVWFGIAVVVFKAFSSVTNKKVVQQDHVSVESVTVFRCAIAVPIAAFAIYFQYLSGNFDIGKICNFGFFC